MHGIDVLIEKLDEFIRKYYKNRLLKGLIYSSALLCSFFLFAILLEYFGEFDVVGRSLLFYGYLVLALFILVFYVSIPLFKLAKLGKLISYEQAAKIVGNHFGGIKDKIVNTLQLSESKENISPSHLTLISASIDQRVSQLTAVSFKSAIDFSENKKYLKFLFSPIVVLLIISFADSSIILNSTDNILHHNIIITDNAPFRFEVQNESLEVIQQENFLLSVKVKGNHFPNSVYVNVDGRRHKLKKTSNISFEHTFRNVNEDHDFYLSADDISSDNYLLRVMPKPSLMGFRINLDYPEYTDLKDEELNNVGDLTLPEGTKVEWGFMTKNTNQINLHFPDSLVVLSPFGQNSFSHSQQFFKSASYSISTQNDYIMNDDTIAYFLNVIKDASPSISVDEKLDSGNTLVHYFNGEIADDYGFTKLVFKYKRVNDGKASKFESIQVPISKNYKKEQFFHYLDMSKLNLSPGESIEHYFVVWDNDRLNGPKSSRSQTRVYKAPTINELANKADKSNEDLKDKLSENLKDVQKLQEELKAIQKSLLEKPKPDWQDKNRLEDFLKKQRNLENKINQMKQDNSKKNNEQNEYEKLSEDILEKQQQLNELFEQLMPDEMKQMYKELQKMLEELNKNQLLNKMDQIELSQEQMEKELDRSLEQFKQMEFDSKLEKITDRLDELAEKQKGLSKETKNKEKSNFQLNKEQEKLNQEFKNIQEEMKELEELNEDLERKKNMLDTKEEEKNISEGLDESKKNIEDKKNKKAAEKQDQAAEDMDELSQMLKNMKSKDKEQKDSESMESLRQLFENLIQFSFEQEEVMHELKGLSPKDPQYVKLGQRQRKLEDDAQLLEDSLFALSKRVMQLGPHINKEVAAMNKNIENAVKHIADRQTPKASSEQQYVMTAANNLALLFDEAIKQMQKQQKGPPGEGECNKPGGKGNGKPSAKSMKEMQDALKKQLDKMKKSMEKADNSGGKKEGKKGDGGKKPGGQRGVGGMSSKEIAQMAAAQSALRKQMEQMGQELNKDGSGNGNGLKKIAKDMEKLEEDIVNKRISKETITRHKDIMTRLLKHEKAQREREFEEKREANEAKKQLFSNPNEYLEYKEDKEKEIEMLKTIPPSLKPYYKNKVNEYFNQIDE